jgi:hypothetical protein
MRSRFTKLLSPLLALAAISLGNIPTASALTNFFVPISGVAFVSRTRGSSAAPVLRCVRRVRQGKSGRHSDPDHLNQSRPRPSGPGRAPDAVAPKHLVLGSAGRKLLVQGADRASASQLRSDHSTLGRYLFACDVVDARAPQFLFTDNETNAERLFGARDPPPWVKDAFHRRVVNKEDGILNRSESGTLRVERRDGRRESVPERRRRAEGTRHPSRARRRSGRHRAGRSSGPQSTTHPSRAAMTFRSYPTLTNATLLPPSPRD